MPWRNAAKGPVHYLHHWRQDSPKVLSKEHLQRSSASRQLYPTASHKWGGQENPAPFSLISAFREGV